MRRLIWVLAVAGVVLIAEHGSGAAAATVKPRRTHVNQLFIQRGSSGTMARNRNGSYQLVLKGAGAYTESAYCCIQTAAGRQAMQVRQIPTSGFIRLWADFGFANTPPTAVLSLAQGKQGADTIALRLSRPRISDHGHRLTFGARILRTVPGNLYGFRLQLDRSIPRRFGGSVLYIDQETAPVLSACLPGLPCQSVGDCVIQAYTQCPNANLSGASLARANLWDANLRGAVLTDADLTQAGLQYAQLDGATLVRTKLTGAQLPQAGFVDADLTNADLTNTDLYKADFRVSSLTGANFAGAYVGYASFYGARGADLTGAHFLCTVMPDGTHKGDCPPPPPPCRNCQLRARPQRAAPASAMRRPAG